jgi:cytochrome d ubiquinol oxidase subunit I
MAGLGVLMILTAIVGVILRKGSMLFEFRPYQWLTVLMGPAGIVSLIAGWITTEAGRQPWVVYGVLRTKDAVSPVTAQSAGVSLLVFVMVYFLVFGTGIYYIMKLIHAGPGHAEHDTPAPEPVDPAQATGRRPLAAATE